MLDTVLNTPPPIAAVSVPGGSSVPLPAPSLYCPFPPTPCHRDAAALIMRTLGWTKAFALFPDEPGSAAKVRSYVMLAARCYPTAAFDRLAIMSDYFSWLFASDDACEELSLSGASPGELNAFLCQVYGVIGVADTSSNRNRVTGPYREALGDIWRRIEPVTTASWRSRFVRHVTSYIEGCTWEACNRSIERIPGRAVYQSMRSYTSTMYEFWDFIEFAGAFSLPDAVVEHPIVIDLARAANMAVSLSNDIFSVRKESSNSDFHNLVLVLEHEEGVTRNEALRRAIELHDAQVRHYCALETLLPSFGDSVDRDLSRYCEGLRTWMRTNYDWSTVTPRYKATA